MRQFLTVFKIAVKCSHAPSCREIDSAFDGDKYRLLFEGARYADAHGFSAVWVPERHFHEFGGLSPNPSVLCAALARETHRIQLRAGSVVLPLHHPIRVAEEWAVVDNISGGRVGVAFASGWNPADFALAPQNFGNHRDVMFAGIEQIQDLWRGGSVTVTKIATPGNSVIWSATPR